MIGDNIKALRNALGLSQDAFADRLGVSTGVITNLEYNRLKTPEKKMPLLKLIAKEFGVSLEWLLNGGPLELPDQTEGEQEASEIGRLVGSDDPVVKAFLRFWAKRTKQEREQLTQQLVAFTEQLRNNMK